MKKKNHLPEEDIIIYDENDSIARSRQKSRKVFVFYIVALFIVALVIILASYVMQSHQQEQLNEQIEVAEGAKNRVQKARTKLDTLQKTVEELQEELDETAAQLEEAEEKNQAAEDRESEQEEQIQALDLFWQLEKAYQSGDDEQAKEIIAEMDLAYGRKTLVNSAKTPLKTEAATEYKDICDALGV
jgi:septal ring factor EnvC (AmiA/AmiB activator)